MIITGIAGHEENGHSVPMPPDLLRQIEATHTARHDHIRYHQIELASTAILRACRRAMGPEAKLLVLERLVGPPNKWADTKFTDLIMLVEPGGRERTPAESEALFTTAGFHLARVVPTATALNVLEGLPMERGRGQGLTKVPC